VVFFRHIKFLLGVSLVFCHCVYTGNNEESFIEFKKEFYSDVSFQKERILFPLEEGSGYTGFEVGHEYGIYDDPPFKRYTKNNFQYFTSAPEDNESDEWSVRIEEHKDSVIIYEGQDSSGLGAITKFRKFKGKWYLTYFETFNI
jgi:hypothetical protein